MSDISKQRLTDNEVTFRRANEKAERDLQVVLPDDYEIYFVCECSEESCRDRIQLTGKQFLELHQDRQNFIVKPHHQIASIEDIVIKTDDYFVVKKKLDTTN